MPNIIEIQVQASDKLDLGKLVTEAKRQGKALGEALSTPFEQTERKARESGVKMSSAMRTAVAGMARELDKLERNAALSGEGMSESYREALAKVRKDLNMVTDVATRTGRGLDEGMSGALRSVQRSMDELKPKVREVDRAFETAGRTAERELNAIEQAAHKAGRSMDADFQRALRGLREELNRARAEGARTGATLESELGGSLARVRQEADKLKESLKPKGGGDKSGGLVGELLGDLGTAKGGALAAGAAVGAALWSGIQQTWERNRVGALIAAQTGAAAGSSAKLGQLAGSIFADNFGESVEDVGASITAVFQNKLIDTRASEDAIERVTKKVLTLQQTTGESANDIARSARQLLVTGLARNMTAAMDMIQTATEHGLNTTGELLDTIDEYSTQFRALGLSGQEAFGLIEQAMQGGARNVDIAADALKEFQIRAQDGSATTARGFRTIGLDANVMGQKIAAGGAQARDALSQTLNKLNAMEPGVARNTAAVDLFGTKAEDLGKALYSMDLDEASQKFGKFGGSVEEASQKLSEGQSTWDKVGKGFSALTAKIGEGIDSLRGKGGIASQITDQFKLLDIAKEQALSTGDTSALDELAEKYPFLASSVDEFKKSNDAAIRSMNEGSGSAQDYAESLDTLISKKEEAAGKILDMRDANRAWQESVDAAQQALKDNGKTLDDNTEKGRHNNEALDDLVDSALDVATAMSKQGRSVEEVTGFLESAGGEFVRTATKMGMARRQAVELGIQLGLIPNNVSTRMTLLGMSYAEARVEQFKQHLNSIPPNKYVNLRVSTQGSGHYFAEQETGGITGYRPMLAAATGGARNGPTVINEAGPEIAELPNGSKVMTKGATEEALRSGMLTLGQGGGSTVIAVSWQGVENKALRGILEGLRFEIFNNYGGDVNRALSRN